MEILNSDSSESLNHIIDGSFEGLLTSVFESYESKNFPAGVYTKDEYQHSLYNTPLEITTNDVKAERVRNGIVNKLGMTIYDNVWVAYLSRDPDRFTKISRYIKLAFEEGRGIVDRLTNPVVYDLFAICRNVGRETSKLAGFIRFSVM